MIARDRTLLAIVAASGSIYLALAFLMGVLPGLWLSRIAAGPGILPLTAEQEKGRQVYVAEGCSYCHTQQVRPLLADASFGRPSTDPVHRHNAHVIVYVLEGSVVMQVKGAPAVTLHPGQTFYEGSDDIHLTSRKASATEPAKVLAFFVKNKGAPAVIPVP